VSPASIILLLAVALAVAILVAVVLEDLELAQV